MGVRLGAGDWVVVGRPDFCNLAGIDQAGKTPSTQVRTRSI